MVDLDNAPALALYEKLGYQKFKQALDVWDGQRTPWTVLKSISRARQPSTPANRLEKRVSGEGRVVHANPRQRH